MTNSIKIHVNKASFIYSWSNVLSLLFIPKYWICAKVHVVCEDSLDFWFGHNEMCTLVFPNQQNHM